jgi:hypothetical protein
MVFIIFNIASPSISRDVDEARSASKPHAFIYLFSRGRFAPHFTRHDQS